MRMKAACSGTSMVALYLDVEEYVERAGNSWSDSVIYIVHMRSLI